MGSDEMFLAGILLPCHLQVLQVSAPSFLPLSKRSRDDLPSQVLHWVLEGVSRPVRSLQPRGEADGHGGHQNADQKREGVGDGHVCWLTVGSVA